MLKWPLICISNSFLDSARAVVGLILPAALRKHGVLEQQPPLCLLVVRPCRSDHPPPLFFKQHTHPPLLVVVVVLPLVVVVVLPPPPPPVGGLNKVYLEAESCVLVWSVLVQTTSP